MTGMIGTIRLRRVNHLTYCVKDRERATKFWVDVLGVNEIPQHGGLGHHSLASASERDDGASD